MTETLSTIKPLLIHPPGPSTKSIHVLSNGQLIATPNYSGPSAPQAFQDAVSVRSLVFVVEQKCQEGIEVDEDDQISWHWIIYATLSTGTPEIPAATIRLIPAQTQPVADDKKAVDGPNHAASTLWDHKEPYVTIGRLSTLEEFRGRGYARVLVEAAAKYAEENPSMMVKDKELGPWRGLVMIHAQIRLENWYATMGFVKDDAMGTWWEDGLEHVGCWRRMNVGAQK